MRSNDFDCSDYTPRNIGIGKGIETKGSRNYERESWTKRQAESVPLHYDRGEYGRNSTSSSMRAFNQREFIQQEHRELKKKIIHSNFELQHDNYDRRYSPRQHLKHELDRHGGIGRDIKIDIDRDIDRRGQVKKRETGRNGGEYRKALMDSGRRSRPCHSTAECCFHFATSKCLYDTSCRFPHNPLAVKEFLNQLVCKEKARSGFCEGCSKHHGSSVIDAYKRYFPDAEKTDDANVDVKAGVDTTEAGEIPDYDLEKTVASEYVTFSTEQICVFEDLLPTPAEITELEHQLQTNPRWQGMLYTKISESAIELCTPTFVSELVNEIASKLSVPCSVSIVKTDASSSIMGIMVKHPKICIHNSG
jgi:hypothetical protein